MDVDDSEPRFIISVVDPTNVWGLVSDVRTPRFYSCDVQREAMLTEPTFACTFCCSEMGPWSEFLTDGFYVKFPSTVHHESNKLIRQILMLAHLSLSYCWKVKFSVLRFLHSFVMLTVLCVGAAESVALSSCSLEK